MRSRLQREKGLQSSWNIAAVNGTTKLPTAPHCFPYPLSPYPHPMYSVHTFCIHLCWYNLSVPSSVWKKKLLFTIRVYSLHEHAHEASMKKNWDLRVIQLCLPFVVECQFSRVIFHHFPSLDGCSSWHQILVWEGVGSRVGKLAENRKLWAKIQQFSIRR